MLAAVLAGSATAADSSNPLVAYGLLGIILVAWVVLTLSGRVVSGREYDRVIDINDRLSADNTVLRDRLIASAGDQVRNTDALREVTKVARDMLVVLEVHKRQP
ncbi:MAG: hypothetical protein V4472_25540 [Pseudomonadota bacterium]